MSKMGMAEKILEALKLEEECIKDKAKVIISKDGTKFVNLTEKMWGFMHWEVRKVEAQPEGLKKFRFKTQVSEEDKDKIEISFVQKEEQNEQQNEQQEKLKEEQTEEQKKLKEEFKRFIAKGKLLGSNPFYNNTDDYYMPLLISGLGDDPDWRLIDGGMILDLQKWELIDEGNKRKDDFDTDTKDYYIEAKEIVNGFLEKAFGDNEFMGLFGDPPFGYNVSVKQDDTEDYTARQKVFQPGEGKDAVSCIDLFGIYTHTGDRVGEITIFTKAIEGFIKEHGLNGKKTNFCAYVMAHELFHAYQDFWVLLKGIDGKDQNLNDMMETLAEGFAFGFVRDCLKDEDLFQALYKFRDEESKSNNPLVIPYDKAVQYFKQGVVSFDAFYEDLKDWKAAASERWTS